MAQIRIPGASALVYEGTTYEADAAGTFELPPEAAEFHLRFPYAKTPAEWDAEEDVNPSTVAELKAQVAVLSAAVAQLTVAAEKPAKKSTV